MSKKHIYDDRGLVSEYGKLVLSNLICEVEIILRLEANDGNEARAIGSLLYKVIGDMVSDKVAKLK